MKHHNHHQLPIMKLNNECNIFMIKKNSLTGPKPPPADINSGFFL